MNNIIQQNEQKLSNSNLMSSIRYGIKCKIFKDSLFIPASIFIDSWFSNIFLWIATDQQTYLFDISFIHITCYSLELQLAIKYESSYKGVTMPRYIIIKDFTFQISVIFEEEQNNQNISEKNLLRFIDGKKPEGYWKLVQKIIQTRKREIQLNQGVISPGFSRFFKLIRIELEKQSVNPSKILNNGQGMSISVQFFKKIIEKVLQMHKSSDKNAILSTFQRQKKTFNADEIITTVKIIYCHLYMNLLKTLNSNLQLTNKPYDYIIRERIIPYNLISTPQSQHIYNNHNKYSTCFQFLMRLENSETNYIISQYKVNQSLPLTDYFCFSSHNTYLTGNQLTSDCKITRYIEDLKKGIKCVELDVHNDGLGQPIITHAIKGKGFCKPISFRDTIQAIDEYLQFHHDHYPIILSIQNHANKQNQDLMNNIISKQFNKSIVKPKLNGEFYQLNQLRGKIIIKTSSGRENLLKIATKKILRIDSLKEKQSQQPIFYHEELQVESKQLFDQRNQLQSLNYQAFLQRTKQLKRLKSLFNSKIDDNSFTPLQKIAQITCMFKAPKGIDTPDVSSFQCTSMINHKIIKTDKQKVINYTKKAWMRSYPEGTQISSNNYDFLQLLARGVQIIALNTQTNDDYAIMMNSYFTAGRKGTIQKFGYIEKPYYLLSSYSSQNMLKNQTKRSYKFTFYTHLSLQFKIYSLQCNICDLNSSNPLKSSLNTKTPSIIKVQFSNLKSFNESFFIIYIDQRKFVQCIPLRFLEPTIREKKSVYVNGRQYRVLKARDYQFEDTGIRIICDYECVEE